MIPGRRSRSATNGPNRMTVSSSSRSQTSALGSCIGPSSPPCVQRRGSPAPDRSVRRPGRVGACAHHHRDSRRVTGRTTRPYPRAVHPGTLSPWTSTSRPRSCRRSIAPSSRPSRASSAPASATFAWEHPPEGASARTRPTGTSAAAGRSCASTATPRPGSRRPAARVRADRRGAGLVRHDLTLAAPTGPPAGLRCAACRHRRRLHRPRPRGLRRARRRPPSRSRTSGSTSPTSSTVWRGRLSAVAAARGDGAGDARGRDGDGRARRRGRARSTDPHRAIDWLSTLPQVALAAHRGAGLMRFQDAKPGRPRGRLRAHPGRPARRRAPRTLLADGDDHPAAARPRRA